MNLHQQLLQRAAEDHPVRVGLIGAGKFGAMFLTQAQRTPGMHVVGVADLQPARARATLERVGWSPERYGARDPDDARAHGTTWVTDDSGALIASGEVEVVVDATGSPAAGIRHVLACCDHGKHVVMVNVEADALAGPLLAERARRSGVIYSLAYGDQPALICELVDWARAAGFVVVAAGKGTRHLPRFHASTPDTVWGDYGISPQDAAASGLNAQMFNSFLDGTKSAIEMAAVSNATGLTPAPGGLVFPPAGVDDLPRVLRPCSAGGVLHHAGQVEVVSSLERDGSPVRRDLRWGVYVVVEAASAYVERCFAEYGLVTDETGHYTATYKPFHLIGLELGISIASVALRGEPTGQPRQWLGDVMAVAKRDLAQGEVLDGEGGHLVYGKLAPASDSLRAGALPIGLAHRVRLRSPVAAHTPVRWADVEIDESAEAVRVRRAMETAGAA